MPHPTRLEMASRFAWHRFATIHPFEVQAVLQNACNLRCAYCRCPDMDKTTLSAAQWIDIIGKLRQVGTLRIKWQGGEPTTRPDFAEICAAVQAYGIICAVVTNGIAITRRPALLDSLDEVVVSLDAVTPALHERNRGKGSHALALRAIEEAGARPVRVFVNMVVSRDTIGEVEAMLEFCETRGVGLNAQPVMFSRGYQNPAASHLALSVPEEQTFERQLARWKRQGRKLMFSARTHEHAANWPDYTSPTTASADESSCMASAVASAGRAARRRRACARGVKPTQQRRVRQRLHDRDKPALRARAVGHRLPRAGVLAQRYQLTRM